MIEDRGIDRHSYKPVTSRKFEGRAFRIAIGSFIARRSFIARLPDNIPHIRFRSSDDEEDFLHDSARQRRGAS
ncbi:hypothetical protein PENARI_c010G07036 [Penicillium arizonense]|uniref:Uncharacterized protein n=1 Tax=Penicillium arizonense TaxID=1835702 RepID=A0A1F5LGJ1_PENAI|nr:hypothetical protein PENARI_c010G07036 [Penicillium arizonense]OGE52333.1 hypothetical protein PENARI_c010G07036 [Penicillium arizonense]